MFNIFLFFQQNVDLLNNNPSVTRDARATSLYTREAMGAAQWFPSHPHHRGTCTPVSADAFKRNRSSFCLLFHFTGGVTLRFPSHSRHRAPVLLYPQARQSATKVLFAYFFLQEKVGKYLSTKSICSTRNSRPRRYSSAPASVGKSNASL